jgi:hypothetical protein
MDVVAAVGAKQEPAAVVESGEGALDEPTLTAQSGAVVGPAAGDHPRDPASADEAPVRVVVVAAVGQQPLRVAPVIDQRNPVRAAPGQAAAT